MPNHNPALEPLLTCQEVASRLNIRPSTIRAWTSRRRIASVRVGARSVRYRESDIRALLRPMPALRPLACARSEEPEKEEL